MNGAPIIGFVITAHDSLEHVNALAQKKGCRLVSIQCGLEDALKPAQNMVARDKVEVILSRRGTAYMLRQHMSIPVMSLPESTSSLIRAVKRALTVGPRVAITLFQSNTSNIALCEELLGIRLHTIIYSSKKTLESGVLAAKNQGIDVVIGGGVTQWAAEKHDVPYVHLHEHDEVSEVTFENLISVVHARRRTIEINERYRAILNSVSDGVIAVDTLGNINECNARGHAMLKLEETQAVGMHIQDLLPDAELHQPFRNGRRVSLMAINRTGEHLLVNGLPIRAEGDKSLMGAVYSMQPAAQVHLAEARVRESYKKGFTARYRLRNFWHEDARVATMLQRVRRYAATNATVLITGESGTGKEILAQGIHKASQRSAGPFVSINCSAMPEQLLESELFGYAEGAFTGSRRGGKIGMFELAQGGTVFLDEIGSIPQAFQTRLLRVLQEKEIIRLGSNVVVPLDVRVIAATNRDLQREVHLGHLREDLYFRLNVLSVLIPPLRQRRNDITLIFKNSLQECVKRHKTLPLHVPKACITRLCRLPWPGNVRQLQGFVEHLVVLSPQGFDAAVFTQLIEEVEMYSQHEEAPPPIAHDATASAIRPATPTPTATAREPLTPQTLQAALRRCGNAKGKTAKLLGVSRSTLWRMMQRWNITEGC